MKEKTIDKVRRLLNENKGSWPAVSKNSGVPYFTLTKIASGASPNPRVGTCDALLDYFGETLPKTVRARNLKTKID